MPMRNNIFLGYFRPQTQNKYENFLKKMVKEKTIQKNFKKIQRLKKFKNKQNKEVSSAGNRCRFLSKKKKKIGVVWNFLKQQNMTCICQLNLGREKGSPSSHPNFLISGSVAQMPPPPSPTNQKNNNNNINNLL